MANKQASKSQRGRPRDLPSSLRGKPARVELRHSLHLESRWEAVWPRCREATGSEEPWVLVPPQPPRPPAGPNVPKVMAGVPEPQLAHLQRGGGDHPPLRKASMRVSDSLEECTQLTHCVGCLPPASWAQRFGIRPVEFPFPRSSPKIVRVTGRKCWVGGGGRQVPGGRSVLLSSL